MTGTSAPLIIHPLDQIGEVRAGDNLAGTLTAALQAANLVPTEQDVLVVTSKIISKAEGRWAGLAEVSPGSRAQEIAAITRKDARLVELVLAESIDVVRAVPNVLITRHRLGLVMANAGIDQSNLGPGEGDRVLLLPEDPDGSALWLHKKLPGNPAIVISDSFGRPWRHGVVNVAIGASGLPALLDRRGELDRNGRVLEATQVALADMIATAAGLVTGEGDEGVPAALVCGYRFPTSCDNPAAAIVRPVAQDLFP